MQLSGGQLPPPVQKLAASFRMAPQGNPAIEPYIVHHAENIRACSLLGACSDFLFIQRYYIRSLCPTGFALRRTGVWYIRRNTPVRYNHASAKGGMLMKRAEIPVVVSQKSGHAAGALLFTSQKNNIYCRKMSCANAIEMVYKVNFSDAVHISLQFFLGAVPPPILEAMLMKYISPIRPGRKDTRKLTQKPSVSFTYRVA